LSVHFSFVEQIYKYITKVSCYLQFLQVRFWGDGYTASDPHAFLLVLQHGWHLSSGHMGQRGSWTTWMAYMVTSSSLSRYRKKFTFYAGFLLDQPDHPLSKLSSPQCAYWVKLSHSVPHGLYCMWVYHREISTTRSNSLL
jgi:hypothetical protein